MSGFFYTKRAVMLQCESVTALYGVLVNLFLLTYLS